MHWEVLRCGGMGLRAWSTVANGPVLPSPISCVMEQWNVPSSPCLLLTPLRFLPFDHFITVNGTRIRTWNGTLLGTMCSPACMLPTPLWYTVPGRINRRYGTSLFHSVCVSSGRSPSSGHEHMATTLRLRTGAVRHRLLLLATIACCCQGNLMFWNN